MDILKKLNKTLLLFDGGTGTYLQSRGLKPGELPELWNITRPDEIEALHCAYLNVGSDIVVTNTFGANGVKAKEHGYDLQQVVKCGVACAKQAVEKCKKGYVALDIGPLGKLLKPLGDFEFEDAIDAFSQTIKAGEGADFILMETFTDLYEAKAAVIAAKECSNLPIMITFSFADDARLMTGCTPQIAAAVMESMGVSAVGVNCGFGPDKFLPLVQKMAKTTALPIIVNPNAGMPKTVNGKTQYDINAKDFAELTCNLIKNGAALAGGCCGTTPQYIAALRTLADKQGLKPMPRRVLEITRVTSSTECAEFCDKTVIIGERINPTGKPKLKEALRNNDKEYIINEAINQEANGADILDVNVGLPGIDEPAVLCDTVLALQKVTALPLQIDTSNPKAMEKALRVYNGKPLVNSVNGTKESLDTVLPLVAKYGGAVIGLCLDESGIPQTAAGRFDIAKRIIDAAESHGIAKKDIVIDPLALAVSADENAGKVTLESVKLISEKLGVKTILGVSNVSFGLPQRENVTSAFLTLAMSCGLGGAIMNPCSLTVMNAVLSYNAVTGLDKGFEQYIARATGQVEKSDNVQLTLTDAITKGLEQKAGALAAQLVSTHKPLEVIDNYIVPALDKVGVEFEAKRIFLPQLLKSAAAATAAFESVKAAVSADEKQNKGKVILATVKGDIHDIGKNIVKVMLENYGFTVIDLGRDVAPQVVLQAAKDENCRLVGLSALMTTTLPAMVETVKLINKELPDCKVVVGGAVLTDEYATQMGADKYAADAMQTVRFAEEIFR